MHNLTSPTMKKPIAITKLLCVLLCSTALSVYAQNRELKLSGAEIVAYNSDTKLPNIIRFQVSHPVNNSTFIAWADFALNLSPGLSFKSYRIETDELGMTHERYKQYYNNLPVEGTGIVVHSKNKYITSLNGDYIQNMEVPVSPVLTEAQALQKALAKVNAKRYKWENKKDEQFMGEAFHKPVFSFYPKGELVIIHKKQSDYSAASYNLAFKFNIYAEEPLYRANVFVDAATGAILEEQNLICTIDVTGTASTVYSGQQQITFDSYGTGQYRLRETGRGNGIETYNCSNTTSHSNTDFTNTSTTWGGTGNDKPSTDAHWGAEKTYDYYFQKFNRNSIDNNGYKLLSYVHYDNNYVNAFWDGQRMTYGDGSSSQGFGVMTGLDVCGHEITHGLVSNTASLGNGESGALNEGFADIFGTTIEKFARPSQSDWIMGAELTTNGQGIRNMSDPKQMQQPDTYMGTNWSSSGEVHKNNGPCIYWYYLMCQGGTGTNDNNSAYNVAAIGMDDAAKIAYRGLTYYFTTSTDYAAARNYSIQAAVDLFGNCSPQVITCTNAWYAVGVGTQYSVAGVVASFLSAQTASCSVPATIPFNNTTTNGASYTWDFGDGSTSTLINPTHTYTQAGTYTVKLTAIGCNSSQDVQVKNAYISINPPASPVTTGGLNCGPGTVTMTASGAGTLTWYDTQGNQLGTGTSFTTPFINSTTTYNVTASNIQAPVTGAPAANTTLGGGGYLNYSHYLIFDVIEPLTIQTVDVYAQSAGSRTVELQDATGTVLSTQTVNIAAAGKNTITLNFHVNTGTGYRLAAAGTTIDLYRNNAGAVYPYNIASLVSVTGTDVSANNPAYYYYYYNWTVQKDPCTSAAISAIALIDSCAGIEQHSLENILIYPNPASAYVTIGNNHKDLSVKLIDQIGRLIRQLSFQENESIKIDLTQLAEGIYYLQLSNEESTMGKRLLIQR